MNNAYISPEPEISQPRYITAFNVLRGSVVALEYNCMAKHSFRNNNKIILYQRKLMQRETLQKFAFCALAVSIAAASQGVSAHTRLQTPTAVEGTKVYNNATIGHGCEGNPVIANSIVFPDGTDSIISIDGAVQEGATVADYIAWGGTLISHVISKDVFEKSAVEYGRAGRAAHSPVGNHSWKGKIPAEDTVGLVPFRVGGTFIVEESCAKSVTFRVAIADICKVTPESGFNAKTVNFWTPAVGSKFDGQQGSHAYNSPATYKITRDLAAHPLPEGCGAGVDVVVDPSAAQLNHDMPIPGYWPATKPGYMPVVPISPVKK